MESLLNLLPNGGNSCVDQLSNEIKYLQRVLFLIQEAEEALDYFLKGTLSHFDPHVGDTACQIRAYYFALLWKNRHDHLQSLFKDRSLLNTYAEKTQILMEKSHENHYRSLRPLPLSQFLTELNLSPNISSLTFTLTLAHLLSKYSWKDEEGISQRMDEKKFSSLSKQNLSFTRMFFKHLQQKASHQSIEFIEKESDLLCEKGIVLLSNSKNFPFLKRMSDYNRMILPCFATLEVIVNSIQFNSSINICIIITFLPESSTEFFSFISDTLGNFTLSDSQSFTLSEPVFVIRGISSFSKENFISWIKSIGLKTVILAYGADHKQYSGANITSLNEIDSNLDSFKAYVQFYHSYMETAEKEKIKLQADLKFYIKHFFTCNSNEIISLSKILPSLDLKLHSKFSKNDLEFV